MSPLYAYGAASVAQRGNSTTYRYREVWHQEKRSGKCPTCGKRRTRQATFTATQSPFNVDKATGEPKTVEQIRADLRADGAAWEPDFTCATHAGTEVAR